MIGMGERVDAVKCSGNTDWEECHWERLQVRLQYG